MKNAERKPVSVDEHVAGRHWCAEPVIGGHSRSGRHQIELRERRADEVDVAGPSARIGVVYALDGIEELLAERVVEVDAGERGPIERLHRAADDRRALVDAD